MASLRFIIFTVSFLLAAVPVWAGSSAISKQLKKVSRDLVRDYEAKNPGKRDVSLAAFPFHSSKGLARRNVGFAVSELLLSHFVKSPTFGVVERSALTKVLQEQKLQVTGAVDPDTAVRVGKLIGAQVLLLGSVDKLGGKYHVNARLVDAESAKVVAVAYGELAAALFEEEAKPLLALTPKQQAIGFYFLYNFRHNTNNLPGGSYTAPYSISGNISPQSFNLSMFGAGIRYFTKPYLVVDVAGMFFVGQPEVGTYIDWPGAEYTAELGPGFSVRGNLAWVHSWDSRSRIYLGAGMSVYRLLPGSGVLIPRTYFTPLLRTGYEFKVQARLGISVFVNYDLLRREFATGRDLGSHGFAQFNRLSFEPQVALYF